MNRQQLAHLLRSACQIAGDRDVLVIGSQAILGAYDEDDLPAPATASLEADLTFLNDPDRAKSDQVEAIIGELSGFHQENGYYAEGVHLDTATVPLGWRDRLITWDLESSSPATPHFLEPHDLAASKLAAYREKDRAFVGALLRAGMLDVATLRARLELLEAPETVITRCRGWLDYYDEGRGRARD